jgi:3-oxoacyl-[acyl-carrier protein] reductase
VNLKIDLSNKVALISGGAQGLGRKFTEDIADSGATVVYTSRNTQALVALEKVLSAKGISNVGLPIDLNQSGGVAKLIESLDSLGLEIDILINNIGHTMEVTSPFGEISDWKKVMDLNFFVHIEVTNALLPNMKRRNWGRIVNITSIAGLEVSGPAPFNASKAALTAYTRSVGRLLAIENPGVVMTAVAPGIVMTEGGHWENILKSNPKHAQKYLKDRTALGRFGEESEISGIVTFLASDYASFFHGSIIQVDGGQSRGYMPQTYLE